MNALKIVVYVFIDTFVLIKNLDNTCTYILYTYKITLRGVGKTIIALEKSISVTYSECVFVALCTQHAIRVRYITLYGLFGPTLFFLHYLINGAIFEKSY